MDPHSATETDDRWRKREKIATKLKPGSNYTQTDFELERLVIKGAAAGGWWGGN